MTERDIGSGLVHITWVLTLNSFWGEMGFYDDIGVWWELAAIPLFAENLGGVN